MACTYTLEKSVPSNAVFTDTNTWRGIQNNLTSTATDQSLSAAQGKILNENKSRIVRTGWGKSLVIPNSPHGFLLVAHISLYIIWVAGDTGNQQVAKTLLHGSDNLNITVNANNGTVTVSFKDASTVGAITYIGT